MGIFQPAMLDYRRLSIDSSLPCDFLVRLHSTWPRNFHHGGMLHVEHVSIIHFQLVQENIQHHKGPKQKGRSSKGQLELDRRQFWWILNDLFPLILMHVIDLQSSFLHPLQCIEVAHVVSKKFSFDILSFSSTALCFKSSRTQTVAASQWWSRVRALWWP